VIPGTTSWESQNYPGWFLRHVGDVLWVDRSDCELVTEVPARRNTALVFLNSTGAHGASIPSDAPAGTERYLYQVHFGVDEETKQRLMARAAGDVRSTWATEGEGGYD